MKDFPLDNIIYFDSACVSLKPKQVIDAMNAYYYEFPACAGRSSHRLGKKVTQKVEDSRKLMSKFFNVKQNEIIFTRNTTEAINLVSHSLNLDGTVVTTDKEHNSNLLPWLKLKDEGRIKHEIVETENGEFSMDSFEKILDKGNVQLVAINHVSNLDGIANPIKEITKLAHKQGAKVLIDGAQSAGHSEVNLKKLSVDFYACSGHKMLGPSGTGILFGKKQLLEQLDPFLLGGDTVTDTWLDRYELEDIPHRFEAGLQNYSGIIGMAESAKYLQKIGLKKIEKHCLDLNKHLTQEIQDLNLSIFGPQDSAKRGSITTVLPKKMKIHELNLLLDGNNIMTRSGTFCVHSWFNKHDLPGGVRFSSHVYNTHEEVDKIAEFLKSIKDLL